MGYIGLITPNDPNHPSKIEWNLTNGPLRKLLELLYRYSGSGVRSVGPVGDFLETIDPNFRSRGRPAEALQNRSAADGWRNVAGSTREIQRRFLGISAAWGKGCDFVDALLSVDF